MSWQQTDSKSVAWKAIREFMVGTNGTSGAASVEMTLLVPLLLILAIYGMDFGLVSFIQMEVQHAAQAGAQYAIGQVSYDSSKISTAVTSATRLTAVTP